MYFNITNYVMDICNGDVKTSSKTFGMVYYGMNNLILNPGAIISNICKDNGIENDGRYLHYFEENRKESFDKVSQWYDIYGLCKYLASISVKVDYCFAYMLIKSCIMGLSVYKSVVIDELQCRIKDSDLKVVLKYLWDID